jgi:ubiquinone biosynthesis protein COQ9
MSLMDEKDNAALERGAENDIVRLRWRLKIRENIIRRLVAETGRLRKLIARLS